MNLFGVARINNREKGAKAKKVKEENENGDENRARKE